MTDFPGNVPPGCRGITRRGLLLGAGFGLAAGVPLGWLGLKGLQTLRGERPYRSPFTGRSREVRSPEYAMPGPFPGRVIEVRARDAVSAGNEIRRDAVRRMIGRGMCELTGAEHPGDAWRRFFARGDVVGVKVNPVGRARGPAETGSHRPEIGSVSSPAVLLEVVAGLRGAGVRPQDIIIFERYADEFRTAGYEAVLRERGMEDVRWYASSAAYTNEQLAIDGHDGGGGRDPNVAGYDPDAFVSMGFAAPEHSARDDRRFRSHLSAIVTRMVDKIVTIPCLKDHRSAGVTLALKNLSHGLNNNVARSHVSGVYRPGGIPSGPNQCNTFIPTAVAQEATRRKATLHILDGLIGVYEGGPGSWNPTWATWRRQSLFFATDPVAMDLVGWDIIDAKRAEEGWLPVSFQGMVQGVPGVTLSPRLAALAAMTPEAAALAAGEQLRRHPPQVHQEQFDRRQPEHIFLAGLLGLGTHDARQIEHRTVWTGS
jgi:uncharacterized protein (DUF362 family)